MVVTRVGTLALVLLQAVATAAAWRAWQLHADKQQKQIQVTTHTLLRSL